MQAKKLIKLIEEHYPLNIQEDWDQSGLQMGDVNQNVERVMIGLDCDLRTIEEAVEQHCDMLLTHHPFLFKKLTLDLNSYVGKCIQLALSHHLVIYSSHTPLDKVSMNKWLAEAIGLMDLTNCEASGIAKKGHFPEPMPFDMFIDKVKQAYHLDHVHVAGALDEVNTVAICGGSGTDLIPEIDADCFITGDLKYHTGEQAAIYHRVLVDIGHHAEVIMVEKLKEELTKLTNLTFIASASPDYYRYY